MGSLGVGLLKQLSQFKPMEKDYRVQLCYGSQHSLAHNIKSITTVKSNKNRWGRTTVLWLQRNILDTLLRK